MAVQLQSEAPTATLLPNTAGTAAGGLLTPEITAPPAGLPPLPGVELAGFSRAALTVSGDFYDVLPVRSGGALLAIADVMGKGPAAASFARRLQSLLRMLVENAPSPAELLSQANRLLFDQLSAAELFITAQLALLDTEQAKLTVASAGHCPLLVVNEVGEVVMSSPGGPPLGVLPETRYTGESLTLAGRRCGLLYTDGVIECRDAQGAPLGGERLAAWLAAYAAWGMNAAQIKEALATRLNCFQDDLPCADDQAFLLFCQP